MQKLGHFKSNNTKGRPNLIFDLVDFGQYFFTQIVGKGGLNNRISFIYKYKTSHGFTRG